MRVLVAGGGTGGHITPIRYVAQELKKLDSEVEIIYVGPKGDKFSSLISDEKAIDRSYQIFAGKYRRYKQSWWRKLIDIKTLVLNIRDVFYLIIGTFQSLSIIRKERPDVLFAKGGFISVPLGYAAKIRRIPIVLHDSDTLAGLANRLVSKWAKSVAVGHDPSFYNYPKSKMTYTGIPLHPSYSTAPTPADRAKARSSLKLKASEPVLFVIGGSLGAKSINDAMAKIAFSLAEKGIQVVHIAGDKHFQLLQNQTKGISGYKVLKFIADPNEIVKHYLAADLVISRGGATNTAEISALARPAIVIPARQLADQQKNSQLLSKNKAAVVLDDNELIRSPNLLHDSIFDVLDSQSKQLHLSKNIAKMAKPSAAKDLAKLILEAS